MQAGKHDEHELASYFFRRALAAGVVVGGLAIGTAAELYSSNHPLFDELVDGRSLPLVIVSVVAGAAVLFMLYRRVTTFIRPVAALAVAAVVFGWAVAQFPAAGVSRRSPKRAPTPSRNRWRSASCASGARTGRWSTSTR